LRESKARVELAIHCFALVPEDLPQFLFVAARVQFVVESFELVIAHVREHFRCELRIRRNTASL
jgi:hypothetical protein